MKAATNISHGTGTKRSEIYAGQEIPEEFLADIPDELILEKLAEANPNNLSREQLMIMAGLIQEDGTLAEGVSDTESEMSEEELREALGNFGSKVDILEWWGNVRPDADRPNMKLTRSALEDWIVNAMFEEDD